VAREPFDPALFDRVDASETPRAYVELLDYIRMRPNAQRVRTWSEERLELGPGDRLLDVGCGTGDDLIALSTHVSPDGAAVGIDVSETLIAEARRRTTSVPAACIVRGVAERLPFRDGVFAGCRTERVLLHVADPALAVREIARVLEPAGRVTIVEPDFGAWFVDSVDHEIDALIVRLVNRQRQPSVGRTLRRLLRAAGLVDVELTGHLAVYDGVPGGVSLASIVERLVEADAIGRTRADRYLASLATGHRESVLFSAVPILWAFARKPTEDGDLGRSGDKSTR